MVLNLPEGSLVLKEGSTLIGVMAAGNLYSLENGEIANAIVAKEIGNFKGQTRISAAEYDANVKGIFGKALFNNFQWINNGFVDFRGTPAGNLISSTGNRYGHDNPLLIGGGGGTQDKAAGQAALSAINNPWNFVNPLLVAGAIRFGNPTQDELILWENQFRALIDFAFLPAALTLPLIEDLIRIAADVEDPEAETVFVNIFNTAGDIISSGRILLSDVQRLRDAGQRVDIIQEAEVVPVTAPTVTPQNPFIRDIFTKDKILAIDQREGNRIIRVTLKERISLADRKRITG